jgi:hypothetical protein
MRRAVLAWVLLVSPAAFALPPIAIDVRAGIGGTDSVDRKTDAVVSLGIEGLVELRPGLLVGLGGDITGGGEHPDVSHGHLGVLFGMTTKRKILRSTFLAELGVHGIGGVGDSPSPDASTVRFGYLGVRGGAELVSPNLPFGAGLSLSLRRDLASQDAWMQNLDAPGFVAVRSGGTEIVLSFHAGVRF